MKKRLTKVFLAASAAALMLLFSGCGARSEATTETFAASRSYDAGGAYNYGGNDNTAEAPEAAVDATESLGISTGDSAASLMASAQSRKVILRSSFELETKEFEETQKALHLEIERTGSYIEYSEAHGNPDDRNASVSMTIRVPSGRYNEFKAFIPTIGNVTYSSEGGEDVTGAYFDTDARLKVLKAQEDRILELLAKAETVEEMLQIENELTRIRTEIEQLTSELKRYDDLVSYATIHLSLRQTADYTVVREENFLTKLGNAVKDSFSSMVNLLQQLVIVLVWILPYLLLLGAIALIVTLVLLRVKAYRRGHPKPSHPLAPPSANRQPSAENRKDQ